MSFSTKRLFGRTKRVAAHETRRQAQKLIERGIAAEKSGTADKALHYFQTAVEIDPDFAPARMNLGIALQALGDIGAAIASCERAIALDPGYGAAHYNLARTHLLCAHYPEAEAGFRNALRTRNDFPEAWVGLAGALDGMGRDDDALSALDQAIALRNDYVEALLASLTLLRKTNRMEAAVTTSKRVLELEPENELAHSTLGIGLHALGRHADAESSYRQALAFNPSNSEVKRHLAQLLRTVGRVQEAISLLLELAANDPTNTSLRRDFAEALSGFAVQSTTAKERSVLLNLCMDDETLSVVVPSIIVSMKNDEGFKVLAHSARRGDDPFASVLPPVATFLSDPFFGAALPRIKLADPEIEETMTYTRRCILFRFAPPAGLPSLGPDLPMEFICAMARQGFFAGYPFYVDESEKQQLAHLREALHEAVGTIGVRARELEPALAIISLYESLDTLQCAERLLEQPATEWSEAFRPIVREQIQNRMHERQVAGKLTSITAIEDKVSKAVRELYEANPYPRWVAVPRPHVDSIEKLSARLRPGQPARIRPHPTAILVAGCGTGRHSVSVASAFPDSTVLAVDLSLSSLAYASRMTEALGISNITYQHGDILNLGKLGRRFDIIECAGVLHHLADPMTGWRILVDLLEPDGFMKVALYSEKARSAVNAARKLAQSLNVPGTPDGIRHCRRAIIGLPAGHPARGVLDCGDFFSLDECRDLIMHVQEHQFTLPLIGECLDQLGLQFLGFECSPITWDRFRKMFPDKKAEHSLGAWDEFEQSYPATFLGTYCFWCARELTAAD